MIKTNRQLKLAARFIKECGVNIFLTGKAGTGKTTFLKNISKTINKRMVVAAPTGVAAINARGVTLHSLFQLPFSPNIPEAQRASKGKFFNKLGKNKLALIRSIEILVIDEISMVRGDILDAVDSTLRRVRRNNNPFGGVQLLMIGDIQQLSPICRDDEWQLLSKYYQSPYFFDSKALKECEYITLELKEIFRQNDSNFTELLNSVRDNNITQSVIEKLNSRYIPNFTPSEEEGYITLTTHNNSANQINRENLESLSEKSYFFTATIANDYPESSYPNSATLELKEGAQVIFIKNDTSPEKLYYNGMIGKITSISEDKITVQPNSGKAPIVVSEAIWENIEYKINDGDGSIEERIKGSFTQIPLKCAWAITIHKSQGLSFDKAIIDAGASFAHGQVYVALSRCRTFEGIVLKTPITVTSIVRDNKADGFSKYVSNNEPTNNDLERFKKQYFRDILCEIFNFTTLNREIYQLVTFFGTHLEREYPAVGNELRNFANMQYNDIFVVGEKFQTQLNKAISASQNYSCDNYITTRLFKASEYFLGKLEPLKLLLQQLGGLTIDDKDVKKRIIKSRDILVEDLEIKECALALCSEGFSCEEYLKRKYELIATTDGKAKKESASKKQTLKVASDIVNGELYFNLCEWRKIKAVEEGGKAHFQILSNRTLVEIQAILPNTPQLLSSISGIGTVKIDNYGVELLEMVIDYIESNNIDIAHYHSENLVYEETTSGKKGVSAKVKEKKVDTVTQTLELYNCGKNIEEIASERELSVNTIYSHICKLITNGDLALKDFLDHKTITKISTVIESSSDKSLRAIKEQLGDNVTWEDIKLVMTKFV